MIKYSINDLYAGQCHEETFVVSEDTGRKFADISLDYNPIHLDQKAASESRFGKKIVHGMLIGSYFSGIIGNKFPGAGSVYISQNIMFRRPVYYDTPIVVKVEVKDIDLNRNHVFLKTQCFDREGVLLVDGEAKILYQ